MKTKKKKSKRFIIILITLIVLVVAGGSVGGYFIYKAVNPVDNTNYATDIFYEAFKEGKIDRIKYSDYRSEDFEFDKYVVYMYDFEADSAILNNKTCSLDDECKYFAEQNAAILDLLLDAKEAGIKVFILNAQDLGENAAGVKNEVSDMPYISLITDYRTREWGYSVGADIVIKDLTLKVLSVND